MKSRQAGRGFRLAGLRVALEVEFGWAVRVPVTLTAPCKKQQHAYQNTLISYQDTHSVSEHTHGISIRTYSNQNTHMVYHNTHIVYQVELGWAVRVPVALTAPCKAKKHMVMVCVSQNKKRTVKSKHTYVVSKHTHSISKHTRILSEHTHGISECTHII